VGASVTPSPAGWAGELPHLLTSRTGLPCLVHTPLVECRSRCGEVPEWSNGAVSKTVDLSRGPWVRIPPSPPGRQASPERCPSGRRSTLGKRVWGQLHRGFESRPLRQLWKMRSPDWSLGPAHCQPPNRVRPGREQHLGGNRRVPQVAWAPFWAPLLRRTGVLFAITRSPGRFCRPGSGARQAPGEERTPPARRALQPCRGERCGLTTSRTGGILLPPDLFTGGEVLPSCFSRILPGFGGKG
jgi:hypothetical protein